MIEYLLATIVAVVWEVLDYAMIVIIPLLVLALLRATVVRVLLLKQTYLRVRLREPSAIRTAGLAREMIAFVIIFVICVLLVTVEFGLFHAMAQFGGSFRDWGKSWTIVSSDEACVVWHLAKGPPKTVFNILHFLDSSRWQGFVEYFGYRCNDYLEILTYVSSFLIMPALGCIGLLAFQKVIELRLKRQSRT